MAGTNFPFGTGTRIGRNWVEKRVQNRKFSGFPRNSARIAQPSNDAADDGNGGRIRYGDRNHKNDDYGGDGRDGSGHTSIPL